jgi:hypothetical protein
MYYTVAPNSKLHLIKWSSLVQSSFPSPLPLRSYKKKKKMYCWYTNDKLMWASSLLRIYEHLVGFERRGENFNVS